MANRGAMIAGSRGIYPTECERSLTAASRSDAAHSIPAGVPGHPSSRRYATHVLNWSFGSVG